MEKPKVNQRKSIDELSFHDQPVDSTRILYTPSTFAKSSLLYLQETGDLQAMLPHTNQRSNLSSFLFFTVLRGEGTLTYEGNVYVLREGDCVFLDCQKQYSHATGDVLWALKWVHFDGPNMFGVYQKYHERGGICLFHPENAEPYITLLSAIYRTALSPDYVRDMRINELLSRLLTLLMEASWSPINTKKAASERHVLRSVKDYLDENFAKKITLNELAERFFINKFYLARIFKEQYGYPVINYVLVLRIARAKQLLRFSDLTMEKIGEACGMQDANYFSRVFNKVEGTSPSEYRKQW